MYKKGYKNIKKGKRSRRKRNKEKILSICLLLAFTILSIIVIINTNSNATVFTVQDFIKKNNLEIIEVGVSEGDTFWTIQKKYLPEHVDIREAIFWAKEINEVDIGNIKPFSIVKVFKNKDN